MDSKEKTKHIQKTAFNLFLENGYEATSIRLICKQAGIAAPSLYNFFDSKKGLFLSIVHSLWEEYKEEINRYFNRIFYTSPAERLYEFFKFSIKYTIENLDNTRFFLRFSLFPPSEVQQDIINFLLLQQKYKLDLISSIVFDCKNQGLINIPQDQATSIFTKFVNSNTFDIVFSNWSPSDEEVAQAWDTFYEIILNLNPNG